MRRFHNYSKVPRSHFNNLLITLIWLWYDSHLLYNWFNLQSYYRSSDTISKVSTLMSRHILVDLKCWKQFCLINCFTFKGFFCMFVPVMDYILV